MEIVTLFSGDQVIVIFLINLRTVYYIFLYGSSKHIPIFFLCGSKQPFV